MTTTRRPRILIVTRNLPPLVGGMEQLNWHMADELARSAEVRVIGPVGSAALVPSTVEVHEAPLRPLWNFLLMAHRIARREASKWCPDFVLAGSGLTAPIAQSAAHVCGAKVAVYVHGLDVAVQSFLYRLLWLPSLRRADRLIANSRATVDLCIKAGITASRIGIVHPGVALPALVASRQAPTRFRTELALDSRPLLLSVGRLTQRKGLCEFVIQCLPRIAAAYPDVLLLVVGEAPEHSLHAQAQTPASIQAAADAAGLANNLRFLGVITDRERLATIYQSADVHVFPVRTIPGDPEGFGMVAIEAAAHGLPTVAFATGGVVDAVSEGQSGYLVANDDYAAFAEAVLRALRNREAMHNSSMEFAQDFSWPRFGAQLTAQLTSLMTPSTTWAASP